MSSEYYSLEKAAEVLALPTAEVNRLREKNQLRAFRDGSSWKFRKVDVDNFLVETIKNRGKANQSASESDFDLLGSDEFSEEAPTVLADLPSFDSIMEEGLALGDNLIDASPAKPAKPAAAPKTAPVVAETKPAATSEGDFALADDDLMLAGDDLTLSEDSDVLPASLRPAVTNPSASDVDLASGEELVLDGGTSSGINLAGDSGLSLLDIADDIDLQPVLTGGSDAKLELDDDDDILSLVDDDAPQENTSTIAIPIEDDFQLTADTGSPAFAAANDSDSASQVIALDEDNVFGSSTESGFGESPFGSAPTGPADQTAPGSGFGTAPFGSMPTGEFVAQTPAFAGPASVETTYTSFQVVALVFAALFLILPGMMILDLIIHIWSWGEPFVINSSLMDLFAGMAGLK